MVALTDNAVTAVKKAIAKSGKDGSGFRVMIENGGCAGFKYKIGLDAAPRDGDAVVDANGVRVFVDPQSAPMLEGVTIDFVEEMGRAGFSFQNPNAQKKCNCGKSFC
ncbi:MAG: iron-sulfur cluster assembly accessory protein [Hyphomicrobiaceae bacterium]|nr:iron-sulfur cluster assembly accessory protein [Hyphomicrobiaceae bacterium]